MPARHDTSFIPGQRKATTTGFPAREPKSVADRLDTFLQDNPNFLDLCADYTRHFVRVTGVNRVGMQAVVERVRWERKLELKTDDFRVNNSFTSFLSRLVMGLNPELAGVYETRKAPAAEEWVANYLREHDRAAAAIPAPRQPEGES